MKRLSTWHATWDLIRFHPRSYATFSLLYLLSFAGLLLPGLVLQAFFDRLTEDTPARSSLWTLLGLLFAAEGTRIVADFVRTYSEERFRCYGWALLRTNIMRNVLRRPGADLLPLTPGDAVSRMRGDVMELADWPSWLPFELGQATFAVVAFILMLRINPRITLVTVLPLVAVVVISSAGRGRLLRYMHAGRDATGEITGFLGEVLDGVIAVKTAVAEGHVTRQLDKLNDLRRRAEVRFDLYWSILGWAHTSIADLALGVVLLLAGSSLRQGQFTVGDFTLFVSYLRLIVDFPATFGSFLADYQTQAVSIDRLQALQPDAAPASLVAHTQVYLDRELPEIPRPNQSGEPLHTLTINDLTYHYPGTERATRPGIENVTFQIRRGEFIVITGRVGAGKTTLLRALLGLLPVERGTIRWNDTHVETPDDFFSPPRTAYTPQVPQLFSETLKANILMGRPDDALTRTHALQLAVLENDLAALPQGLETDVGPRGVRLSGGQVQRAAAARMFAQAPELLVLDDISSALDVETEQALWERILALENTTTLAVSHRSAVLRRADRIIVLHDGRVEDEGTLDELLDRNATIRDLWAHGRG